MTELNPYDPPNSPLGDSPKKSNLNKIIMTLIILFLSVNAIYIFSVAIDASKFNLSFWGFANIAVIFGLLLSKSWASIAFYIVGVQSVARSAYITYMYVSNAEDISFVYDKIISSSLWAILWVVFGVYLFRNFKSKDKKPSERLINDTTGSWNE